LKASRGLEQYQAMNWSMAYSRLGAKLASRGY
jgi:hypothetical protein